jgi:hypothetical protein
MNLNIFTDRQNYLLLKLRGRLFHGKVCLISFVALPLGIPSSNRTLVRKSHKRQQSLPDLQHWLTTNWTDFKELCKQNQTGLNDVLRKISKQMKICLWDDTWRSDDD